MTSWNEKAPIERAQILVQMIAIIIASIWGIYAFIYKEITLPSMAPVNTSLDLQLQKTNSGATAANTDSKSLDAIEITASIKNPSRRTIKLLPSAFIVWGLKYDFKDRQKFDQQLADRPIAPYTGRFQSRHATLGSATLIAIGSIIPDNKLKPNEIVKRKFVLHVPRGAYHALEAIVQIPSAREKSEIALEWKWDKASNGLLPVVYRVNKDRERIEMETDGAGNYLGDDVDLQMALAMTMYSLR